MSRYGPDPDGLPPRRRKKFDNTAKGYTTLSYPMRDRFGEPRDPLYMDDGWAPEDPDRARPLDRVKLKRKDEDSVEQALWGVSAGDVDVIELPRGYYDAIIYRRKHGRWPDPDARPKRTSGRRGPKPGATVRCGVCGVMGHNRRSCPEKA